MRSPAVSQADCFSARVEIHVYQWYVEPMLFYLSILYTDSYSLLVHEPGPQKGDHWYHKKVQIFVELHIFVW